MTETIAELRGLSDEELVKRHDDHRIHGQVVVGTSHYVHELERRDMDRQTQAMVRYTGRITFMTAVVTVATIVNVVLAFCPRR